VIRKRGLNATAAVGVYSGSQLEALNLAANSITDFSIACYSFRGTRDYVEWDAAAGASYEIQLDQFGSLSNSQLAEWELAFLNAPGNDLPTGAIPVVGMEARLSATNTGATLRPGELTMPGQSGANSVWFVWRAPTVGVLQVSRFEPTRYDDPSHEPGNTTGVITVINIGPGCAEEAYDLNPPFPFVPILGLFGGNSFGTNEARGPNSLLTYGTNSLTYEVVAERDYWIQLDGEQGSSGETPLTLLLIPPPVNDDFTNRIILPSESLKVKGRTFASTREPSDPVQMEQTQILNRSVWWEWRAPLAGRWVLFVTKGFWENKFVVYRGDNLIPTAEAGNTVREPVIFDSHAGEVFQIGAFALGGFGGNLEFTLTPVQSPGVRLHRVEDYWPSARREVTVQLPDNSGLPYVLERSEDLSAWIPVSTNVNAWSHFLRLSLEIEKPMEFFRTRLGRVP
jgi:hypothetical protein